MYVMYQFRYCNEPFVITIDYYTVVYILAVVVGGVSGDSICSGIQTDWIHVQPMTGHYNLSHNLCYIKT